MPVILTSGCIHLAEWQVSFGVSCKTYLKNLSDPQWNVQRLQHVIWGISTYLHLQAMVICCDPHCDLDNLYTLENLTDGCPSLDGPWKRDSLDKKAFLWYLHSSLKLTFRPWKMVVPFWGSAFFLGNMYEYLLSFGKDIYVKFLQFVKSWHFDNPLLTMRWDPQNIRAHLIIQGN